MKSRYKGVKPFGGFNVVLVCLAVQVVCTLPAYGDEIIGWGWNNCGQATPPAGNDFIAIAAGTVHSLALKSDGSIVGWGDNTYGQSTPPAGKGFVAIAAGGFHSLALKSDGSIVGWGDNINSDGQATPPAGNNFTAIAAGAAHSLALKSNGSIAGWGSNYGLYVDDYCGQANPPAGNNFTAIAAGYFHSLALKSDGSMVGWGANADMEHSYCGQETPPVGHDFTAIIAAGAVHSLALKSDGRIAGWGCNYDTFDYNYYGQATPPAGKGFVAIAAGAFHSLALKSDGSIVGWGDNKYGEATPPAGSGFVAIAAGGGHSLGLWQEQQATLSVIANPTHGGTVSGSGTFEPDSQQILSATANTGWTFTGWSDGNTSNPRTVTIPAGGAIYTANFQQQNDTFSIVSMSVRAGKRNPDLPADSFMIKGTSFDLDSSVIPTQADEIEFAFFNEGDSEPRFVDIMPFEPLKFKNGKYADKNANYAFIFDVNKHIFSLSGKQLYLCGLGSPLRLEITIGDVLLSGVAYDNEASGSGGEIDVINGKQLMPMQLLSGYEDSLRVDKCTFNLGTKASTGSLTIQGAIAVEDTSVDIAGEDVVVSWGDYDIILPANDLYRIGSGKAFKYKKPKGTNSSIAAAVFDLEKCTFKIIIKNADIGHQGNPVDFSMQFADFSKTVTLQLTEKKSGSWCFP